MLPKELTQGQHEEDHGGEESVEGGHEEEFKIEERRQHAGRVESWELYKARGIKSCTTNSHVV